MKKLKHKKEIIIINFLILILAILAFLIPAKNDEKEILHNKTNSNYIINSNAITMMYETEAGSGEYQTTTNTSWPQEGYIFNERLSRCENGGTLSWNSETNKVIMESNTSDRCYVYFDIKPLTFAEHIINNIYTADGENGLYYHDGIGSYTNADQEAGDNSYRYSGADPNNYVCFGSDAETCPNEHLYRIIGVFDDNSDGEYNVKLIKADYTTGDMLGTDGRDYAGNYIEDTSDYKGNIDTSTIATYRWNYDTSVSSLGSNNWATSELNKINLNTNYLNYLGSSWSPMIEDSKWYLGGFTRNEYDVFNVKLFYNGERNNAGYGSNPTTYGPENANGNSTKIGLMYPSDYGYAAYPDAWATYIYDYDSSAIKENNWLYMGLNEWTITQCSSYAYLAYYLYCGGAFFRNNTNEEYAIRPVFYLKPNISYVEGNGTKSNPYKIN